MNKILLIILAVLFCTASARCNEEGYAATSSDIYRLSPSEDGLDIVRVPDDPLPEPVSADRAYSVKFIIDHRSALDNQVVTVEGLVVEAIPGKKACPPEASGCAQPRIFIADDPEVTSGIYRLMIILSQDDEAYLDGGRVKVKGKVHASEMAVYIEKEY